MKTGFMQTMLASVWSTDTYILIAALLTAGFFAALLYLLRRQKAEPERDQSRRVALLYSLFTTAITIFPLLGMFGTVRALIGLDLSGDMSRVQENFFAALTSTAWGIIFAILFKVCNALIAPAVERVTEREPVQKKVPLKKSGRS